MNSEARAKAVKKIRKQWLNHMRKPVVLVKCRACGKRYRLTVFGVDKTEPRYYDGSWHWTWTCRRCKNYHFISKMNLPKRFYKELVGIEEEIQPKELDSDGIL